MLDRSAGVIGRGTRQGPAIENFAGLRLTRAPPKNSNRTNYGMFTKWPEMLTVEVRNAGALPAKATLTKSVSA